MATKKVCKVHARSIREASTRYLQRGLEVFKGEKDMIECYRSDAKDLREVASVLRTGDIQKAASKATCLDTIVREAIPDAAWEFLTNCR